MNKIRTSLYIMLLLLTTFSFLGCNKEESQTQTQEIRKIPVTAQRIEKSTMEKKILLGGLFQPNDHVSLAAKNPAAKIVSVPVELGDQVAVGTPLVIFDARDLDLQLEQAQLNYERNKALYDAGAVSKSQLEQIESTLDNLLIQKEATVLTSPVQGEISSITAVEGQLAGATPLVSVVNIKTLKLELQVGETYISSLKKGQELLVNVPVIDSEPIAGIITNIAPHIDSRTKVYPVTVAIDNTEGLMKGGMYGEVELVVSRKEDALVIPQYAIVEQGQKKVVYVVENGTAKLREVEVGLTLADEAEIVSGLQEGDLLVIEGQYGLRDDTPVATMMKGD